jgi:long-chain acyl-CoA synthetase
MLYDRWRRTVHRCRTETALIDAASGQRWTFSALAQAADRQPAPAGAIFPRGASPEFVLAVLAGWKAGAIVCPLEEGQWVPELKGLPGGCVHLKTTSASTGRPRLIAFAAEQLAADAEQIVATMGLRPEWANMGVISLAHSYGFSNLVLPLLLHGVPLILGQSPLPESLRQAAAFAQDITLAAVPALWRAWLEARMVPENVRLAISAGAPLPLLVEQQAWDQAGLKIHNFYGSSECGGIAYDEALEPRSDSACVGRPMHGVNVSLGDDGCLDVRSAAVGLTYWPDPSSRLQHGIFRTSDIAEIENGAVFLRGRQTDQINVAGRKVSPESIEHALAGHEGVRDCIVFGVPSADSDRSETIVACVVVEPGCGQAMLREYLLEKLPPWQLPRDWWFVPALETNLRGKRARAEWRAKYLERKNLNP